MEDATIKEVIPNVEKSKLWIYLLRYSKLGPSLLWMRQSNCKLEEQCRALCDKVVRHLMSKVYIDHSPIKSPNFPERPSEEVVLYFSSMSEYLFDHYPHLYTNVLSKLNVNLKDERQVCRAYSDFAEQLFLKTISWPLIVSLLTFSGGLAIDCAKNGRSILVRQICDWATIFICLKLKEWLNEHQGWDGILSICQESACSTEKEFFGQTSEILTYIKDYYQQLKKTADHTTNSSMVIGFVAFALFIYSVVLSIMPSSNQDCLARDLELSMRPQ